MVTRDTLGTKQDKQCTYNVILWRVYVTFSQWKQNKHCVFELHVAVSYINILSVIQQCFYDKFISSATMPLIRATF